jgi:hypothetical protein
VELPFLATSLDAFQRWLRGVELLSEDRSSVEGAENLCTALATLRQEGCDDVAKLVEKDLAAFGLEIPASRN